MGGGPDVFTRLEAGKRGVEEESEVRDPNRGGSVVDDG